MLACWHATHAEDSANKALLVRRLLCHAGKSGLFKKTGARVVLPSTVEDPAAAAAAASDPRSPFEP